MKDTALRVAAIIFFVVSLFHLARLIFRMEIAFANFQVPLWFSLFGFVITAALAIWFFTLSGKKP